MKKQIWIAKKGTYTFETALELNELLFKHNVLDEGYYDLYIKKQLELADIEDEFSKFCDEAIGIIDEDKFKEEHGIKDLTEEEHYEAIFEALFGNYCNKYQISNVLPDEIDDLLDKYDEEGLLYRSDLDDELSNWKDYKTEEQMLSRINKELQ